MSEKSKTYLHLKILYFWKILTVIWVCRKSQSFCSVDIEAHWSQSTTTNIIIVEYSDHRGSNSNLTWPKRKCQECFKIKTARKMQKEWRGAMNPLRYGNTLGKLSPCVTINPNRTAPVLPRGGGGLARGDSQRQEVTDRERRSTQVLSVGLPQSSGGLDFNLLDC